MIVRQAEAEDEARKQAQERERWAQALRDGEAWARSVVGAAPRTETEPAAGDPAEAMRAACERIAREAGAVSVADRIAALRAAP